MKWKDNKDICFMRSTHDKELVQTRDQSQDVKKPKVVTDYNSMMAVYMSDAFLVSYHSTRKRLKKYYQKHFHHLIGICCLYSHLLKKTLQG
jgi:hypothetical protein